MVTILRRQFKLTDWIGWITLVYTRRILTVHRKWEMWKKLAYLYFMIKCSFVIIRFFIIRSRAKHTYTYILANKKRIPPKCIQRKRPNKDFLPATIHSNLHTEKDRRNIFWMKYIAESLALTDYYTSQKDLTLRKIWMT